MPEIRNLHANAPFCVVKSDFSTFDRQYADRLARYHDKLQHFSEKLCKLENTGVASHASRQLFIHAKWLTKYTAYWSRLDSLLDRLDSSFLEHDQSYVAEQSPHDGSWGWHFREFHHKFDATIGRLHELAAQNKPPEYALDFLEPVATRDRMIDYLERLRISDIAETGRNQRDEYGAVLTCLGQICFKPGLRDYVRQHVRGIDLSDDYIDAFEDFLDRSQNPGTGYWGPWYRSNGRIYRYDDLSFTFHIISYRKGRVQHWPEIIATTFANKAKNYPQGWLSNGRYNNHNNYDVAKVFRFGWPHMSAAEKERAQGEIGHMLNWCLTRSMDGEGRFQMDANFYNSREACYYFGVSFLDEVGYFDPGRRFWSGQRFPDSRSNGLRIRRQLDRLNPGHDQVTAARWKLDKALAQGRERSRLSAASNTIRRFLSNNSIQQLVPAAANSNNVNRYARG